jgi:hypothetical protein
MAPVYLVEMNKCHYRNVSILICSRPVCIPQSLEMSTHNLDACPLCHSTKYLYEDSKLICENGHESKNYYEEKEDVVFGIPKRKIKKRKRRKIARNRKRYRKMFIRAKNLPILSCQIVLEHQIKQIQEILNVKEEFETIVKEFWLDYVTLLDKVLKDTNLKDEGVEQEQPETPDDSESSDQDDTELPLGLSLIGFKSERREKSPSETYRTLNEKPYATKVLHLKAGSLLAILYLACVYLRIPVIIQDFMDWILKDKLMYFNIGGIFPEWLAKRTGISRLRSTTSRFFNSTIPDPYTIEIFCSNLALAFKVEFGTIFPPMNSIGILFRMVSKLYLPVPFYHMIVHIFDFSNVQISICDRDDLPTAKFMAVLIFTAKLIFGTNYSSGDPHRSGFFQEFIPSFAEMLQIWNDHGILNGPTLPWRRSEPRNFSIEELDEYLNFCKNSIISNSGWKEIWDVMMNALDSQETVFSQIATSLTTSRPSRPRVDNEYHNKNYNQIHNNKLYTSRSYMHYIANCTGGMHPEYKSLLLAGCRIIGWTRPEHLQRVISHFERDINQINKQEWDGKDVFDGKRSSEDTFTKSSVE